MGNPRRKILETRRRAEFITPIPKPKKRKRPAEQEEILFDEGKGLSTKEQQYDPTSIINEVRGQVSSWRTLPDPIQWAHKEDRITFTARTPWAGDPVCAEGRYMEGDTEKRAAIFIGPEFGTVQRADLVAAAREAGDAGFDVLIACAFNYEAHTTEFSKLGRIPVKLERSSATAPTASPAGSSTPTTTKRASSSATPTSSAPTTRTVR